MSSLRNAVKRRTHKERAQPSYRKHHGLLEKKKDYKQRANVYNENKIKLNKLRLKAALRNPHEFNMGMVHKSLNDSGQHFDEDNSLTEDEMKLVDVKNLAYLENSRMQELGYINRLKKKLHNLNQQKKNTHVFFAADRESAIKLCKKKKELEDINALIKPNKNILNELEARKARLKKVNNIIAHTRLKKQLQQKGQREEIVPTREGNAAVYRWKQVRRR